MASKRSGAPLGLALCGVLGTLATVALTALASWPAAGSTRWLAIGCGTIAVAAVLGIAAAAHRERARLGHALAITRQRLPAEVLGELDFEPPPLQPALADGDEPHVLR